MDPLNSVEPVKKSPKPFIMYTCIGLIVVLLVALGIYYSLHSNQQNNTKNSSPSQVQGTMVEASSQHPSDSNGLVTGSLPLECVPRGHDYYRTENTLAVDPKNSNIVYVGIEYKGVYKSIDGGSSWLKSDTGIRGYAMESDSSKKCIQELGRTIIDPHDNTHLLISRVESPGDLYTLFSENAGVYESNDSGATWHQLVKDGMNASGSRGIAFDPQNSKTIYYGTNNMTPSFGINGTKSINKYFNVNGIVYKTSDGGANWKELPTGADHGFRTVNFAVDPTNSKKLWLFSFTSKEDEGSFPDDSAQKSALISNDGGQTWQSMANKLPTGHHILTEGMLSTTNGNNAFVITESQPGSKPKSFATKDGGLTWKDSNIYVFAASYDPNDQKGERMLGYAPYENTPGIYQSLDGGLTWSTYSSLPTEVDGKDQLGVRISSFAWGQSDKNTVYMDASGAMVWKSTDNGKTWKTVMNLNTVGGKNKNKDGKDVSREQDGGSAQQ